MGKHKLKKDDLFRILYDYNYIRLRDLYGSFLKPSKSNKTVSLFNFKKMREVLKKEGLI